MGVFGVCVGLCRVVWCGRWECTGRGEFGLIGVLWEVLWWWGGYIRYGLLSAGGGFVVWWWWLGCWVLGWFGEGRGWSGCGKNVDGMWIVCWGLVGFWGCDFGVM